MDVMCGCAYVCVCLHACVPRSVVVPFDNVAHDDDTSEVHDDVHLQNRCQTALDDAGVIRPSVK